MTSASPPPRDPKTLPFPLSVGYWTLAVNGAKGGGTKYCTLQFLNYARWASQKNSCNVPTAIRIVIKENMIDANGRLRPLGFFRLWRPYVTFVNETVHWGIKVPLAIGLYEQFRETLGPHGGLLTAVALSTCGEVAACGWSERMGVHMGLRNMNSYRDSLQQSQKARGGILAGAYAGSGGLWLRNFSWNYAFFEWKRFLHNAVDRTPDWAPGFFCAHLNWLRTLEKKDQANFLTFEAATLGTYLTFFNMAGDNIKTKMSYDPARYPSFSYTVKDIYQNHGLMGFCRGSLFKGVYLIMGATVAIGIQERLSEIMAVFLRP